MTIATPADSTRSGLDTRIREAWATYRENLLELDGVAYDQAERAEWEYLQVELREIAGPPASPGPKR